MTSLMPRTFVEMSSNVPTNVFKSLNVLEGFVEEEKWKSVIQTKIPDYLKKMEKNIIFI